VPALSLSFIFAFLFYPLHLDFELNSEPSDFDQYQTLRKRTRKGQHNPPPPRCFSHLQLQPQIKITCLER